MHLKLKAMYLHLKSICKASSGFKLQLFAFKTFPSLKSVAWLVGLVRKMPKICPTCLQPALAKGVWAMIEKKFCVCPYAGPSNLFFSLSLQLLWKPLGRLKLPFRHQGRSLACSYLAVWPFSLPCSSFLSIDIYFAIKGVAVRAKQDVL